MNEQITQNDILVYLSLIHEGNWDNIASSISKKLFFPPEEVAEKVSSVTSKYVTYFDDDYPPSFRKCPKPPYVLYYRGDIGLLRDPAQSLSIVGSRGACPYGKEKARGFASFAASNGFSVVSGLARGIDTEAAYGALNHGKSVAILGSGIDNIYPSDNHDLAMEIAANGLLISEYPNHVGPSQKHFPFRNRLIAAASSRLIVPEATKHSGTLITVAFALRAGRDIGAVPYRANEDSACNEMIKQGAMMIEDEKDLKCFLGLGENDE